MRNSLFILVTWFFILAFPLLSFAQQEEQPCFRSYTTADGLPSPEIYSILRDHAGYLWFGTDNGLSRFDGYTFTNYGFPEGLGDNVVFALYEDAQERIWISTMSGQVFLWQRGTIKPWQWNHLVLQYEQDYSLAKLVKLTAEGTAYLTLANVGVLRINPDGSSILYRTQLDVYNTGIWEPGFRTLPYTDYPAGNTVPNRSTLREAGEYPLRIRTSQDSFRLNLKYKTKTRMASIVHAGGLLHLGCGLIQKSIRDTVIWSVPFPYGVNSVHITEQEEVWVSLEGKNGIAYFEHLDSVLTGRFTHYLAGVPVSNVYPTNDNELWVSTLDRGVLYVPNFDLRVFDTNSGLKNDFIASITTIGQDTVVVGTNDGTIHFMNSDGRVLHNFTNQAGRYSYDLFYHEGRLYTNGGFYEQGEWRSFLRQNDTSQIYQPTILGKADHQHINRHNELIGIQHQGFFKVDLQSARINYQYGGGPPAQRFFAAYSDANNTLWLANEKGLHYFDFNQDALVAVDHPHPALHRRIEAIDQLADGTFVLASKGYGLVLWRGDEVQIIESQDGLTSNMLEHLFIDEEQRIWIATLNGANSVQLVKGGSPIIHNYQTSHGLPIDEVYTIVKQGSNVWLGTARGVVRLRLSPRNTRAVRPGWQLISVNGRTVYQTGRDTLNPSTQLWRYQHNDNNLHFEYLAINYKLDGEIQYRYRLAPDKPWQYTYNRTITYPELAPGTYTFEVQAENQDRHWSSSLAYSFTIRPAWWDTVLARILFLGLLFGGGYWGYDQRLRQLALRQANAARLDHLQRSALQAQMSPHFIFNCLQSIQYYILKNNTQRSVEYLSRFASLVRHNLHASIEGEITVAQEMTLLRNYLTLERDRFNEAFDFAITYEGEPKPQELMLSPLLLQPIVENAVLHGVQHREAGLVRICFRATNQVLEVIISDNGPGWSLTPRLSTSYKSVGMSITQQRLALLNNRDDSIVVTVTNPQSGTGTTVNICLPLITKKQDENTPASSYS